MDIAKRIIAKCGGPDAVADMLKMDVTNVRRWTYPKDRGGTGGIIPKERELALFALAKERGIKLRPVDFFPKDAA